MIERKFLAAPKERRLLAWNPPASAHPKSVGHAIPFVAHNSPGPPLAPPQQEPKKPDYGLFATNMAAALLRCSHSF